MSIGVIIVSYNTRRLLQQCLESLRTCSLALRVVVVDNASHDGSAALLREQFPAHLLVEAGYNAGFAAATNLGLAALGVLPLPQRYAGVLTVPPAPVAEYLLVLNPDTIVHAGAIEALLAFLQAHPRVAVVSPRLLNPDGSIQDAAFRFPTLSMTLLDLFPPGEVLPGRLYRSWWHGRYPQEQLAEAQPFAIDHPLGACMLVRRAVIEEVGAMDARYFLYSEEVEWCWRIRRAGWAIWQEPRARVTHVGGASTRQVRARALIDLYRSRLRFLAQSAGHTQSAHRWLIRAGMLRMIMLAWFEYARGSLSQQELAARLWAAGAILRLTLQQEVA